MLSKLLQAAMITGLIAILAADGSQRMDQPSHLPALRLPISFASVFR